MNLGYKSEHWGAAAHCVKSQVNIWECNMMDIKPVKLIHFVFQIGGNIQTHYDKHSLVKRGPSRLISFGGQEARVGAVAHQSHLLAHG